MTKWKDQEGKRRFYLFLFSFFFRLLRERGNVPSAAAEATIHPFKKKVGGWGASLFFKSIGGISSKYFPRNRVSQAHFPPPSPPLRGSGIKESSSYLAIIFFFFPFLILPTYLPLRWGRKNSRRITHPYYPRLPTRAREKMSPEKK